MRTVIFTLGVLMSLAACKYSVNFPKKIFAGPVQVDGIDLPEGFKIHLYADNVVNARSMALSDKGTLFVGTRGAGNVYALRDNDGDNVVDERFLIAEDLNLPNGVALKDGDLYVAEVDKIWKYSNIESNLASPPAPVLITDAFPSKGHHGWKYIAFGPDDKLYIPVGAPCNVCESDTIFSTITRMDADGKNLEIVARGIRNTVGFDWDPSTKELWFTDNGRDLMGDNIPFCELNHVTDEDQHFGFPYCHQGDLPDPKFGKKHSCDEFIAPYQNLGPHVAPLGMEFYESESFPEKFKDCIFIAEHGSWNRSTPIGYRVMMVDRSKPEGERYIPFAEGWLPKKGSRWGRPVDLEWMPDGSLLVSDDFADAIYRIYYDK